MHDLMKSSELEVSIKEQTLKTQNIKIYKNIYMTKAYHNKDTYTGVESNTIPKLRSKIWIATHMV